jgi:hypothetical protein
MILTLLYTNFIWLLHNAAKGGASAWPSTTAASALARCRSLAQLWRERRFAAWLELLGEVISTQRQRRQEILCLCGLALKSYAVSASARAAI